MALTVVDSDVLIDALRGREPWATRIADELGAGTLATTVVTAFELRSAGSGRAREAAEMLLAAAEILPLDDPAARSAAEARRGLEAHGEPIGMADYLIAGICLSRSVPLLTRNRRHFGRVEGLALIDI